MDLNTANKMKKQKIKKSDFQFSFSGYGHYKVTYISPVTYKEWSTITHDMPLIDATKNSEAPKKIDLIRLKNACKNL